jgi:pimeloyl-ACP methyl ester carboxylesterase
MPALAERHTVIAPDLLGHGESAKPRGDYSLGAFASGVRDILVALGHQRATVVGHSLGGGVAMQFAYQYPEYLERMVLVSSGGLGREVSALLRSATLPGSEIVLPLMGALGLGSAGAVLGEALTRIGVQAGPDIAEIGRGIASLQDAEARRAFIHTARSILDAGGQRVSARDRLYLAADVPTLIVWGRRDPLIPVQHGIDAHAAIPGSTLEVFEKAGHFPHRDQPGRFTRLLLDFIDHSEPAELTVQSARELMLAHSTA